MGRVLNCLEPLRLDSDFRWGTFRVVEARRAGVDGTPRRAGGLRGTVDGSANGQLIPRRFMSNLRIPPDSRL